MRPGPRSRALAARLAARESRNVTFLAEDFPIFWESAERATVTDADGNRYIDCTAAFGVANVGHSNPQVLAAVAQQAQRLIHGMGDVHPTAVRVALFERLMQIVPRGLQKCFLATTGSEAVEAALKTAMLYSEKSRFAAFRGGYHGLSFGALNVAGIQKFRAPFERALQAEPLLLDYPREGLTTAKAAADDARRMLGDCDEIAALIVEPIAGRAGILVPPAGYLRELSRVCDELGVLLIVDEILTGFGRTGAWFAIERENVVPDLLCVGKAMGSGFPISAVIGTTCVMDAWPLSTGEALHTSTYLGHPLGCAAAIATIEEIERLALLDRAQRLGELLAASLEPLRSIGGVASVRGRGALWAVQLRDARAASACVKRALREGAIFLQSGVEGDAVAISPPLVIEEERLDEALRILAHAVEAVSA